MESPNELTPQQYRKYNGQSVLSALRSIGREASAEELTKYIGQSIGQSEDLVKPEVKQVLRRGIINGFLVRKGKNYSLSGQDNIVDIDAPKKRRRISFNQGNPKKMSDFKKQMSDSEENPPASELRLSQVPAPAPVPVPVPAAAPAPSSSTLAEPNFESYGQGGSRNIPKYVSDYDSDDSEQEEQEEQYEQKTFASTSSEEESDNQQSFISFLRQHRQ